MRQLDMIHFGVVARVVFDDFESDRLGQPCGGLLRAPGTRNVAGPHRVGIANA